MSQPNGLTVLVTGFEPFSGSTLNPSQVIAESIAELRSNLPGFVGLHTALLPVDSQRIASVLDALWDKHEPNIVLHLGESAKADRLTLERVAINLLDFDTPDNAGQVLTDQPIDPQGPAARFATLPIRELAGKLAQEDIDCERSLSAGAYLCNQTLYLSLGHAQQRGGRAVGFVHVPSLPEQVALGERQAPAMPRAQLLEHIQRLIAHAIDLVKGGQADIGH
jgi:pyroglutamyl-peptidase